MILTAENSNLKNLKKIYITEFNNNNLSSAVLN